MRHARAAAFPYTLVHVHNLPKTLLTHIHETVRQDSVQSLFAYPKATR